MKNILQASLLFIVLFGFSPAVHAQYFAFGKNRVVYDNFDWRFIQSEHFDVYYYDAKNYDLAEFSAMSLESALKQLRQDFQHEIVDRIRVIIYDSHNDFSQTNVVALPIDAEGIGGVTDKLKNRITLPFDGDYNDFRRTLHHELVHAVFNDMFYGGSIQSIISNNIQLVFPLWFEEGLAEYTALGWDTQTDMYIRDGIINGYLPPIRFLGGFFNYRGGQSIWNFIVEEYGREKIGEILNRIRATRSIEAGFLRSIGLSTSELSNRWQDALKKRYFPEVAEREDIKNFSQLLTQRGLFGTFNTSPSISPQGDKIAFITNSSGPGGGFNIEVISAIDGRKLKTLINGQNNSEFEELNILNPNITWSPDGRQLALSTKFEGSDDVAIVDYETRKVTKLRFSNVDAIGSVNWSPDGKKLVFDGNSGPFQDIFVYEFATKKFYNVTQDFFSDEHPIWGNDSETIYFVSARGEKVDLNTYKDSHSLLLYDNMYSRDLYSVKLGDRRAVQLTKTPDWDEVRPQLTRTGRMVLISDQNGINNIYEFDLNTRTMIPLTDLRSGLMQISISADGSRLAINTLNDGFIDIYLMKSPFARAKSEMPAPNYWGDRRKNESQEKRVPATGFVKQMYAGNTLLQNKIGTEDEVPLTAPTVAKKDSTGNVIPPPSSTEVDFRNYVFAEEVIEDSTLKLENLTLFEPENSVTDDGRFRPKKYRLNFSPDIIFAGGQFATSFNTFALTQILFTDLLGDHEFSFGSNLALDLRNSSYQIQYGYLKNRTNYFVNFFHFGSNFQTFQGDLLRFRTFGGGLTIQYPFDKFKRVDVGLQYIGLVRDLSNIFITLDNTDSDLGPAPDDLDFRERAGFFYPTITYTSDKTTPGFLFPQSGTRYSVGLSGSPAISSNSPSFVSALGDFRHYFDLGSDYSFAFRASGAVSEGKDKQTFFIGGTLGWINQKFSNNSFPFERLADSFFTLPALPLRGYEFNALFGSRFALANYEFRFPLFAALLPGPIPILPLFNMTGVAFIDAGTAWGFDIDYNLLDENGQPAVNDKDLDFKVGKKRPGILVDGQGNAFREDFIDGDILIGAGFGLRTIFLGLPFRYDVGWPYQRTGFDGGAIHYISVGVDF